MPVEYDPILSKLVVHAETRDAAIDRMKKALAGYTVVGIKTPTQFLSDIIDSQPFREGKTLTSFIDTYFSSWQPAAPDKALATLAFIADDLAVKRVSSSVAEGPAEIPLPWQTLGHWRL